MSAESPARAGAMAQPPLDGASRLRAGAARRATCRAAAGGGRAGQPRPCLGAPSCRRPDRRRHVHAPARRLARATRPDADLRLRAARVDGCRPAGAADMSPETGAASRHR